MTMDTGEFLLQAHVTRDAVAAWTDAGWLIQYHNGKSRSFTEADVARAQLICDLQLMGVNEEAIPIILDLLDQMYGLRGALRALLVEMSVTAPEGH